MARLTSLAALTLLALSAGEARAQWSAGVKGGSGQGAFTGTSEFTWKPGALTASLFFSKPVMRSLSFQPELVLTEKVGESVVGTTSLTFNAEYFVVPLLLRFDLPGWFVRPYVLAGPSIVMQARCHVRFVTSGLLSEGDCEDNPTANGSFNRLDLGVDGGVGLRVPFGPTSLLVEGRGSTSLRTEIVPLETNASRSFSWSVLAGFTAPLSRARRPAGAAPLPGEPRRRVVEAVPAPTLPSIPSEAIVTERSEAASAPSAAAPERLISVSAVNADVRPLLIGVAREAGIDLIVTTDVNRRVSINLRDVPALEAITAIAAAADLSVSQPRQRDLPSVVYYDLPVNVNTESAATIAARFGVSVEMARFIVEARGKREVGGGPRTATPPSALLPPP